MTYRNKTYVCFDADNDMESYEEMLKWKDDDRNDFNFYNAHDLNNLRDGSLEDTIKRKLRERLNNTKVMVVLVGEKTKNLHKFVRWEQEVALEKEIPIIAANLNEKNRCDNDLCPPIIRDELVVHVPFDLKPIQTALDNWPDEYLKLKKDGISGPRYYSNFDR
ncbi:TIR domain-containing protein [Sporomusa acidovorans]|uniref:Thoeris protein ThsB TIR-like domain-containing protein n=1 Tax=Sporomusa acidovorans (strain ATCC 49682 / DSM 3132 / Mol) TaxID=1123286 RepID=A0ABZ3J4P5_SPOA4|nr:TIR domain-containing protein [Sporomusa acidovorans]OZC23968.1 hypothetical protein SPACI_03860 [Sporomusa acidovorans DSM 3132]SDF84700.1 MTH538 TIR-like domain [Sporomusa acidovorans]